MQRQSLGSPSSSKALPCEEEQQSEAEAAVKKQKQLRSGVTVMPYIHLIPILTILCFLILYLSSHDPSLNDLAQFNTTFLNSPELENTISDIKKGDILAIRSLKNLKKQQEEPHARRFHRKFVHF